MLIVNAILINKQRKIRNTVVNENENKSNHHGTPITKKALDIKPDMLPIEKVK
jgi:hypothetical protein